MATTHKIADLALDDRPRERLAAQGAHSLSTPELLGILLRVGVQGENAVALAGRVLAGVGGLPGLHRATLADLARIRGVGPAKGAQLMAAVELGRRIATASEARPAIRTAADAAGLLHYQLSGHEQEHFYALPLDTRNRLIGQPLEVYHGSLNTATIRVGEVFRGAIKLNAAALIVAHNHPSGDPAPSADDIAVSRALVEAGKLLDIDLLDHLIIGRSGFVSLKERGLL